MTVSDFAGEVTQPVSGGAADYEGLIEVIGDANSPAGVCPFCHSDRSGGISNF